MRKISGLLILVIFMTIAFCISLYCAPEINRAEMPRIQVRAFEPSRGGERSRTITFECTAYTHTGNLTASQTFPHRGTIAADNSILPMGTRVNIPGYGYGVVEDKGSDIRGMRLDLFMESESECWTWGRQTVKVEILN